MMKFSGSLDVFLSLVQSNSTLLYVGTQHASIIVKEYKGK